MRYDKINTLISENGLKIQTLNIYQLMTYSWIKIYKFKIYCLIYILNLYIFIEEKVVELYTYTYLRNMFLVRAVNNMIKMQTLRRFSIQLFYYCRPISIPVAFDALFHIVSQIIWGVPYELSCLESNSTFSRKKAIPYRSIGNDASQSSKYIYDCCEQAHKKHNYCLQVRSVCHL